MKSIKTKLIEVKLKRLVIDVLKIVGCTTLIILIATNHVDDGNIFGIYVQDGHLLVGDFWSGLLLAYMVAIAYRCGKHAIQHLLEIKKLTEE